MFSQLLNRGKCAVGLHQGEWAYVEEGHCRQILVCERCAAENEQTEHQWATWQPGGPGECIELRACARCGESERRTVHDWGEPVYAAEGNCAQVRPCRHCDAAQPARVVHQFDAWVYTAEDACTELPACSRCGMTANESRTNHQWDGWQPSIFYEAPVRVCARCGALQRQGSEVTLQEVEAAVEAMMKVRRAIAVGSSLGSAALHAAAPGAGGILQVGAPVALQQALTLHKEVLSSALAPYYFRFASNQFTDPGLRERLRELEGLLATAQQQGVGPAVQALVQSAISAYAAQGQQQWAAQGQQPMPAIQEQQQLGAQGQQQPLAQPQQPAPQGHGGPDTRLVGHWRRTESMASGGFSMATDYHLLLYPDGQFQSYSKSAGSFGSNQSEVVSGQWSANGTQLFLRYPDGTQGAHQITVSGNSALVDGSQLWERIR